MKQQQFPEINTLLIHTIQDISQDKGGVPVAVLRLIEAIANYAPSTQIKLAASPGRSPLLSSTQVQPNLEWHLISEPSNQSLKKFLFNLVDLKLHDQSFCIIHDHGLWLNNNHIVAVGSRRLNIPRIVSTHGMLYPWAWQYKAWKKRIAWYLFQKNDLITAKALHATALSEALHLQQFFPNKPIAVIPHGVDLPPPVKINPKFSSQQTVLFLGRIHPVKGLINLVEAWAQLHSPSWQLVIAGPDENNYLSQVKQKAEEVNIINNIRFIGAVEGEAKWKLYHEADLFVLPSFTENFGIVVAEALASRTPAIVTKGAPWSDLETYNCGWWIDIGIAPLVEALREAMTINRERRNEMGNRGRQLVESKYSWKRIAENMLEVYEWLLDRQPKPNSILEQKS